MSRFGGGKWAGGGGAAGSGDIEGVTAGNGLTGGGTSGTVSLAVGAGTGITVNADDVAVNQATSFAWTAAQSWTVSDAVTDAVTDVATWTHATSGTAAANFGIGHLFKLEDAAGNSNDAARIGIVWTTATDASEDSQFQLSLQVAGTLTSVFVVDKSSLVYRSDQDSTAVLGRLRVGNHVSDHAYLSHFNDNTSTAYAIRFDPDGDVNVGCPTTGGVLSIHTANAVRWLFAANTMDLSDNGGGRYIELSERADPTAPTTNRGRIYMKDNGSGKTQLVVLFPTGAAQVLATEP